MRRRLSRQVNIQLGSQDLSFMSASLMDCVEKQSLLWQLINKLTFNSQYEDIVDDLDIETDYNILLKLSLNIIWAGTKRQQWYIFTEAH